MQTRKFSLAGALTAFGLASSLFAGETITVDNVTDLTNQLDRLNRLNTKAFDDHSYDGNRHDTIILKKGFYDVSGCEMLCSTEKKGLDYIDSFSHIAISWLTLKGETDDPKDVVIYGNQSNRIVYMWLGTIQGVTISNGYARVSKTINGYKIDKTGGGLASRNSMSAVTNCVITCCKAGGSGGGLYCANCYDVTVENCEATSNGGGVNVCSCFVRGVIRNNRAGSGGGGMVDSVADGTVISNNYAGVNGGGVYSILNKGNGLTNCLICCNTAEMGGGVSQGTDTSSTPGVNRCVISNNTATEYGGGLYNCPATDTHIIGNTAKYGGGADASLSGWVWRRLLRCVVTGNVATSGGGIAHYIQADDCFVSSNTADNGGGAYVNCKASNTVFACNAAANRGGGAYDMLDSRPFENCTFYGNRATYGGGMSHVLNARNCTVSNNVAVQGGGIYMSKFYGGKLLHNVARYATGCNTVAGGGAASESDEPGIYRCEVFDAEVAGNAVALETSTSDRSGGAGEHVHFKNCRIYNNFGYVGAAVNWGSVSDCIISNNVSLSPQGKTHSHIRACTTVLNCTVYNQNFCSAQYFDKCRITGYAGKWTLAPGENVYTNGVFVQSNHMKEGDSLFGNNLSYEFSVTNCLITGNSNWNIIISGGKGRVSHFVNCTIASNVCKSMFGGFHPVDQKDAVLYLKNMIIVDNKDTDGNDWNFWPRYGSAESSVMVENCMIGPGGWRWTPETWPVPEGYTWKGLIVSNNAGFMKNRDPEHPYSLRSGSQARRKGTVEAWMADAYDIRGNVEDGKYRRLRDNQVDLGCYQCWLESPGGCLYLR